MLISPSPLALLRVLWMDLLLSFEVALEVREFEL
jgi:hypothetical protein